MSPRGIAAVLVACASSAGAAGAAAQQPLGAAAAALRAAWLAHDADAFLGGSASLVLTLPGAEPAGATPRDQAGELLRRYWRGARERGLRVVAVREVRPGVEGFVEFERRYVGPRTGGAEARVAVYVTLRREAGEWVVAEVRVGA